MSEPTAADTPGGRLALTRAQLPTAGVVRVHPKPTALPPRPGPQEMPHNRFDDPHGQFRVRYAASTCRGALIEVLAGFRPNGSVEARLAVVTETTAEDQQLPPAGTVPAGLVTRLRIARMGVHSSRIWFVDVAAAASQTVLGALPTVAAALTESGLGTRERPIQLDAGTIALAGPVGRRITQTVARAVFADTDAGGLRYTSRVDTAEECWAIFDTVGVWVTDSQPLHPEDPDLTAACMTLGLTLPGPQLET